NDLCWLWLQTPGSRQPPRFGVWQMAIPRPMGMPFALTWAARRARSLRASQLKRSDVRAIVLCNAPHELASGAVAFLVDHTACASRGGCGCGLQAPLIPRIPVLLRLCTLPNCCVHSAVHFVYRLWRDW